MKPNILLLIVLILSCCNSSNEEDTKQNANDESFEIAKQDKIFFDDMLSLSKSEAISKYGSPSMQEQFILNNMQGEFRRSLFNFYTEQQLESNLIQIEELTWEKNKDTWFTVWYQLEEHKSIPKDTFTWKKGIDF